MTQTTSENAEVRYKIGDVCRIADVQPYVLRYWESEFPFLATDRSVPGPRTYSERELQLISQIKKLLYDEGYTIAGAKKRLESEASGPQSHDTNPAVVPLAAEKDEGKPPEKLPARPRSVTRPATPRFTEASPVATQPSLVGGASGVDPAKAEEMQTPDPRIENVVAELKEILKLLT
ncbi:MAG: MerR family transcriptional regulator [Thermoanaerobaculia bacterium]